MKERIRMFQMLFKKKKRGFTLIELLAVIVLISILSLITISIVFGNIQNSKSKTYEVIGETIKRYLVFNYNNCKLDNIYDDKIFNSSCELNYSNENFNEDLIINSGYTIDEIKNIDIDTDDEGNFEVTITLRGQDETSNDVDDDNSKDKVDDTNDVLDGLPNKPDLINGLVPIVYKNNAWYITDENDNDWYDYDNQKWANAALIKNGVQVNKENPLNLLEQVQAMFVWIPRYSYTIGCLNSDTECYGYRIEGDTTVSGIPTQSLPGAIDIKFINIDKKDTLQLESVDTIPRYRYDKNERVPSKWYTHPAFTFGNKELSGIWVGKFHTGIVDDNSVIIPDVKVNVNKRIYYQFNSSKNFGSYYGLSGDTHMMKNSEYGAVAYLSQSKYGKYGNKNFLEEDKQVYANNSNNHNNNGFYTGRSSCKPTSMYSSPQGGYKYDGTYLNDSSSDCGEEYVIYNGTGASSNGDITGVYDMSGGAYEYVMANYNNNLGKGDYNNSIKSLIEAGEFNNYYNKYGIMGISNPSSTYTSNFKQGTGHATYETARWYNDDINETVEGFPQVIKEASPWVRRGYCSYTDIAAQPPKNLGIFAIGGGDGNYNKYSAFRIVLIRD